MAGITHTTQATLPDDPDAEIGSDEWNAAHSVQSVAPSGLTGATQASRYVGATASGAPASGTFAIGDYIIDRSGAIYICTTAGTPGTWGAVGGGSGAVATDTIWDAKGDLAGGTGANTAAKLTVGANDSILVAASGETTGLKWVPGPLNLWVGTFDPRLCVSSAAITSANKAYYIAFQVNVAVSVTQARVQVGAATSGNFDVGIYSAAGSRLASTGSTAAGSAYAFQTVNLSGTVALVTGTKYYAAIAASNTTVEFYAAYPNYAGQGNPSQVLFGEEASAFPLPSTATIGYGASQAYGIHFL